MGIIFVLSLKNKASHSDNCTVYVVASIKEEMGIK